MVRPMLLRASTVLGLLAAAALVVQAAGCLDYLAGCPAKLFYGAECGDTSTGGVGGGTGGTTTTSTMTGGGGGTMGCVDAGSCPPVPPGPCALVGTVTCIEHECGVTYATDAPSQVYGNCRHNTCDATGKMSSTADDLNVFVTGNPCIPCTCSGGNLSCGPLAAGASCTKPGSMTAGYCEPDPHSALLVCAECNPSVAMACNGIPATTCAQDGVCLPNHCFDGTPNLGETAKDCGGPACLPCGAGKACSIPNDCVSGICATGICSAPSCSDNVKNGNETDIDCGGICKPCGDTQFCSSSDDCLSLVCKPSAPGAPDKCEQPSCLDGVQNGGETGIDCGGDGDGGPVCPPCPM